MGIIAAIVLTAILVLFVLLAFLRFGFVYWIYSTVEDWATVRLGFDYYVSNLIATVFTGVFSLLMPMLAWYVFLGKKQAWGIGAAIGVQFLICAAVYTVGIGVCFDRKTGKPLCYYADTPAGRVWSYTPSVDPVSGKNFRLYTREIREAEDRPKISASANETSTRVSPAKNDVRFIASPSPNTKISATTQKASQNTKRITVQTETPNQIEKYEQPDAKAEEIRQTEETRRRLVAEEETREIKENRRREAENYRIKTERERFERVQSAERERAAKQEREEQIVREREEKPSARGKAAKKTRNNQNNHPNGTADCRAFDTAQKLSIFI